MVANPFNRIVADPGKMIVIEGQQAGIDDHQSACHCQVVQTFKIQNIRSKCSTVIRYAIDWLWKHVVRVNSK